MLDRWIVDDRPAPPLVVVVLTMCAIAGFVFGGVLASLLASGGGSADPSQSPTASEPVAVEVAGVEASCQREPGRDHAGDTVEYLPEFVHDDDTQTAWQCGGDGTGETLTFTLEGPAAIAELGVIPGYAKVDPTEDTDWYPRYRRLTEVLWHFDEGEPVSQVLDPDPGLRETQFIALDEARTTSTLTMEIVSSELGTDDWRNMAVTEVAIMACGRC